MNTLQIFIHKSPEDAPHWRNDHKEIKAAELEAAHIVRQGTKEGSDTIDLVFKDDDGNIFIAMTTGALLKTVTDLVKRKE